ncbi:hypothetical protein FF38_14032 [Lucilia cuprina]|uniref:Uncharacterized protein n=1 Tax=Lucilia cuprina TaxID=7375 RepID=A0A0L0BPR4_LUCCU|nr:hypothetical protein FF38_14032 [Lucilia cuprina]
MTLMSTIHISDSIYAYLLPFLFLIFQLRGLTTIRMSGGRTSKVSPLFANGLLRNGDPHYYKKSRPFRPKKIKMLKFLRARPCVQVFRLLLNLLSAGLLMSLTFLLVYNPSRLRTYDTRKGQKMVLHLLRNVLRFSMHTLFQTNTCPNHDDPLRGLTAIRMSGGRTSKVSPLFANGLLRIGDPHYYKKSRPFRPKKIIKMLKLLRARPCGEAPMSLAKPDNARNSSH